MSDTKDCQHTEVTHAEKITCDQCGAVVFAVPIETVPIEICGGGIEYVVEPEDAMELWDRQKEAYEESGTL